MPSKPIKQKKYRWTKFHNVFLIEDVMSFPQQYWELTNCWYITKSRGDYQYYCKIYGRTHGEDYGIHSVDGMSAILGMPIDNLENL